MPPTDHTLMAIAAFRMTFQTVYTTAASGTVVATSEWTPTRTPCHPANLDSADRALEPIAALLLYDNNLKQMQMMNV